jgi:GNAT superfamily N-acetyltransferase
MVVVRDGVIIGMAWLAVVQRVPSPRALRRASGDLQCVYVIPGERDGGVGGRLVEAVLARAQDLGLERVTVHSSPRAIPAYARRGFASSPRLLHTDVAAATPTLDRAGGGSPRTSAAGSAAVDTNGALRRLG